MKARFQAIAEQWFLTEPLLFSVYCSHRITAIPNREKAGHTFLRSGKGRIEYNPDLIALLNNNQLQEYLRMEMIRILLKHPYQRQPRPVRKDICYLASDLVLQDHYQPEIRLVCRDDFPGTAFPGYMATFEEYYRCLLPISQAYSGMSDEHGGEGDRESENQVSENSQPSQESGQDEAVDKSASFEKMQEQAGEASELWEEDQLMQEEVDRMIEVAEQSQNWGSLKGRMKEMILASTVIRPNCSRLLNGFRSSLLSSKRQLTRMRPSRRYGFDNMGSRHRFSTRLLVAVDVSGSVPSESIRQFFGLVNRFFKYGIEKIDVIQFDSEIKGEPVSLKKATKEIGVLGRSGTNYQVVMDFVCEDGLYDGLIICTDGFSATPRLKKNIKTQILWIFNNRAFYEKHTWTDRIPNSRRAFLE